MPLLITTCNIIYNNLLYRHIKHNINYQPSPFTPLITIGTSLLSIHKWITLTKSELNKTVTGQIIE